MAISTHQLQLATIGAALRVGSLPAAEARTRLNEALRVLGKPPVTPAVPEPEWSEPRQVSEWAHIFKFHRDTIATWFRNGTIQAKRVTRQRWRVAKDEIPKNS